LDQYLKAPAEVWELWILPFSLLALGLTGSAFLAATSRAIGGAEFTFTAGEFLTFALGVVLAFVGWGSNAYIKTALGRRQPPATAGPEPETAKAAP
jgi:hypothetical protein